MTFRANEPAMVGGSSQWLAAAFALLMFAAPATTKASPRDTVQPVEAGREVSLEVVVELDQDDDAVAAIVQDRVSVALGDANYTARDGAEQTLVVAIGWAEGGQTTYAVTFALRSGAAEGNELHRVECAHCTAPQLLDRIAEAIGQSVVPAFPEEHDEPETTDAKAIAPPNPPVAPTDEPGRRTNGKAMYYTGIGMLAGGTGVTLGAAVGFGVAARFDLEVRPLEWALLGTGLATTVIGATLFGVDRARKARTRRRKTARFAPAPMGAVVFGRF